jgi:hypothetical protein
MDGVMGVVADSVSSLVMEICDRVAYRIDPKTKDERVAAKESRRKLRAYNKYNPSSGDGGVEFQSLGGFFR